MSTIPVVCQCGQTLNARSSLAGKRVKCPKCGEILTIVRPQLPTRPKPQQPAPLAGGLDDLFDDIGLHDKPDYSGPLCPQCSSPIDPDALICVECGFNSETGKITRSELNHRENRFDPSLMSETELHMHFAKRALDEGPEEETSKDFGDGKKLGAYFLTIFLPILLVVAMASVTIWGGGLIAWIIHIVKALIDKDYSVAIARFFITIAVLVSMIGWFRVTLHALAQNVYHGILSLFILYFYALGYGVVDWARSKSNAIMLVTGFWLFCLGIASYMLLELNEAGAMFMFAVVFIIVGGSFTAWLGWFRLVLDAQEESTFQRMLSLFVPFYALFYGIRNWEECKKNMLIMFSGSGVLAFGLLLMIVAATTGRMPKTNDWVDIPEIFFSLIEELDEEGRPIEKLP